MCLIVSDDATSKLLDLLLVCRHESMGLPFQSRDHNPVYPLLFYGLMH